ncbi:MAG: NAD-dependent epimerase/dehydratase family protein, partial [Candidatus Methylomirabilis sp.]|nr:NAD-dependent epimerase/dehydratase family protein [Deltaproteobacteria bacterium]
GCVAVYNLAAEHRDDVRPESLYEEVNVGGARSLCAVADAAGIDRIVFTSSVAVYGLPERETDETAAPDPFNEYGRTKLAAERVFQAWRAARPETRSLTIIRPTVVFGEGNRGNVYNLLRQIASGLFVMVGDGRNRKSMAYVENMAAFLEFVLDAEAGERVVNYADKPDLDMNALVALAREAFGRRPAPALRLPYGLAYALGRSLDAVAAATGRSFPVSAVRVKKFCASTAFSARRAAELGFKPAVSLEEGLRRTIASEFGEAVPTSETPSGDPHLLFVSQYFPPESVAPSARLFEMARRWVRSGARVTVLTAFPQHPIGVKRPEDRGRITRKERTEGIEVLRAYIYATPNKGSVRRMASY